LAICSPLNVSPNVKCLKIPEYYQYRRVGF
jgi:hypothetical protein